ncbi:MAG TPA: hypothetical protein PLY87_01900 [Planctomycetaceae bacterium]|nr:hypothetical protein [Planctomycetaceae bacterium]
MTTWKLADQVHKYLREASSEVRREWDCLVDERGKRKGSRHRTEAS